MKKRADGLEYTHSYYEHDSGMSWVYWMKGGDVVAIKRVNEYDHKV